MVECETYSRNGGEARLREKGVLEDVLEIPAIWEAHPGQSNYAARSETLLELGGWETQVQIDLGPAHREHYERLTPFLDVYHPEYNVAIEHEKKEQMRARWHLMKMQAAHERADTLDIDVAVLIFPTDQDPSLRRTRRELEGPFFTEHFPIQIPVFAIEYSDE
ncbi:hypothetical protein D3D02_17195 [Halobellus sp. Atlit-38R]|uniref:hypothetical protein n=1 Tax=Halobellus sp. Atlit-38R TaxID=2282131 RepID=UPI000EF184DC|nr:hypothetical protein [Halobellus sp. Atlit-38R]RLM83666.1 hypothetical protein D3D02_17195 [Halobellus sp. Atlit-38R]